MTLRTHHFESAVALAVLSTVALTSRGGPVEWVGVAAVFFSFKHAIISDRMAERQAVAARPDVECWRWSLRYFVAKELFWVVYFVAHRSWSAIVGCALFLAYPVWRRWWRARHPLPKSCSICGEIAAWAYAPGRGSEVYCDDCVARGCSCNIIDEGGVEQHRDDQGRLLPCCEFDRIVK